MQNLIDRMKSNNESKNNSFSFFSIKSNKNKSSKCQSQISVLENNVKKRFKCLKKKVNGNGVLKKFLSPQKRNKSLKIIKSNWSEEIGKDSGTSGDSGWEGMSAASSLSSLVITGNFYTSSPVSERKFKQFNFQINSHIETFQFHDNNNHSDDDDNNKVNDTGINMNKTREVDKCTTTQLASGNFIRSKSDSEICGELDCDDVAEKIREITRDDPLRQSYPGMSNTTRRESCHQLLKILLAHIDTNQHNEEEDTMDSKIIDETFETFNSDFANITDSVEIISSPKKSMRDTLLEISSRRLYDQDKLYQQNTSLCHNENQSNIVHNVLNVSKSMSTTADNFRDDIDKVMKRFESQKIVEDDEIVMEFNQSLDSFINS